MPPAPAKPPLPLLSELALLLRVALTLLLALAVALLQPLLLSWAPLDVLPLGEGLGVLPALPGALGDAAALGVGGAEGEAPAVPVAAAAVDEGAPEAQLLPLARALPLPPPRLPLAEPEGAPREALHGALALPSKTAEPVGGATDGDPPPPVPVGRAVLLPPPPAPALLRDGAAEPLPLPQ